MTEQVNNGGPAFPEQGARGKVTGGEGMSLRAYFAAKAMRGLLSNDTNGTESVESAEKRLGLKPGEYNYDRDFPRLVAMDAVDHADALIAQLNATQPQPEEQAASVPEYVVDALACAEDALAKAYAVGRDLDSGLTRNAKALAIVREALAKLEHPTESPASEQGLPEGPFTIEIDGERWDFTLEGLRANVKGARSSVRQNHRDLARLALRCGGRVVEGGAR